ncbi:MAG TPA: ATPase domain-containing protein [Aliidongia sp.]|uniref:ATPase domain-containing protein n=1 Tax=Aliidongia sp. TaxID=1914230 RepID=UPI002DDD966B|nr:ATPase domain-containing protein [Aliidongia sp.]HEV2673640.1 ATPase domain-containing protein [Aliidongia sp.]
MTRHDPSQETTDDPRVSTGVQGLDDILAGGLMANRLYLLEGQPGAGKTTLALQFLLAGRERGESGLYVTLSETEEELHAVARSHCLSLHDIALFELASSKHAFGATLEQTLLHPWEVELGETVKLITDKVEATDPVLVVFDSLSEMRLLAQDPLRYRRQILALKQFFAGRNATVLLLDDMTASQERDLQLHSLCHGVITLERLSQHFGPARRRLEVQKMRGIRFRAGYHDFNIEHGGLQVFPRLIATEHHRPFVGAPVPSGIAALDALLDGGPLRGTSTLVTGPAGAGKTTVALQYIDAACRRGERSVLYEFDERTGTLITRAAKQGIDLEAHMNAGLLVVKQVDPAELSPGEFDAMVRHEVEAHGARMIVIDSLTGYTISMPEEQQIVLQLHELLSYLNQQGVVTFLINTQAGLVGGMQGNGINVSFLSDAVLLLRFFEAGGRVRKAISVIKNRGGGHEDAIRELRIDQDGIRIGEPLTQFHGVLTGTPNYLGDGDPLLMERDDANA